MAWKAVFFRVLGTPLRSLLNFFFEFRERGEKEDLRNAEEE
jgi:hypothetical protein